MQSWGSIPACSSFQTQTRQPGQAGTRKVKPIWIIKQPMMGWQWHQMDHMQINLHLIPDR